MTMKRYISLYILLFFSTVIFAQLQVNGPASVSVGENFRVEYSISSDEVSDMRFNGSIPDGLEEIAGPYISTQSSYQIINGHTSSSSSARITYVFNAGKGGSYTIPALAVRVGGKTFTSRAHSVKVIGSGSQQQQQTAPHMHQNNRQQQNTQRDHVSSPAPANNSNVFIRVSANKNTVVEQEPIKLTYKLYSLSQQITTPEDLKMPNVQDFTIYEVQQPATKRWTRETLDGKAYNTVVWKQYIVYPQGTGKLTVPGNHIQINKIVMNHGVDAIEELFNTGSTYHEESMDIPVPPLTINVQPLPSPRPANFSGGVGTFNMVATMAKNNVKAGEPITISVRISGTGNIKLIKQPTINFPTDFETYDPKVSDNTSNTNNGLEGSMTYEYIAVPQNKGKFTIPPIEFSYYDSQTSGYKTIKSQAFTIDVAEADPSSTSSDEEYREQLRKADIYSIKKYSDINYYIKDGFFLSAWYIVILLLLLVSFFVLLYVFRKRALERADIVRMKAKSANKVATKRLRKAAMLMKSNKKDDFYDEVLRALWGYAADKINIPVESLSKENIQDKLNESGCNTYSVEKFTDAISECEYARYAPSQDEKSSMNNTYEMAVTAITEIEESLKTTNGAQDSRARISEPQSMLTLGLWLALGLWLTLAFQTASASTTIETANASYQSGNYQAAITLYEQALKVGDSPELYYNLGNAYYRSNNITKALINYEKAYILDPSDSEVRHNLDYVRTKTVDKLIPATDFFFVSWFKNLIYSMTIYGWSIFSIIMMIISLAALLSYLFTNNDLIRKSSFWLTLLSFMLFILSVLFALHQSYYRSHNMAAIITAKEVVLKKSPEQGSEANATIHEGTHVDIIDDGMKEWKEVELPDGKTGWLPVGTFVKIVE